MESFCYFKVDANVDVRQGTQKCQQLGAALLVIKTAKENEFLSLLIADHGDKWLEWIAITIVAPMSGELFY